MINKRGEQINLPQELLTNEQLTPYALLLYLKLKFHANNKGFVIITDKELGYWRSSLNKWTDNLESCGFIKIHEKELKKRVYQILK